MPPAPAFYVRKTGNDSNAGTSAGAAWLTIGKALGASGAASTNPIYVGAGVYRESVTIAKSATASTQLTADVDGSHTGDAGEVRWTAYTTDDKTAPTTSLLNLGGYDNVTIQNFTLVGGSASCVNAYSTPVSTSVTIQDCTFISGTGSAGVDNLIKWTNGGGEAATWVVERCIFVGTYGAYINITNVTTAAASYSLAFTIRNCVFVGGVNGDAATATNAVINCAGGGGSGTGSGSAAPGGVSVQNCTNFVGATAFLRTDANFSTTVPCYVKNCFTLAGLSAATSGQIVEDYNHIVANTARVNVSTGTNSIAGNTYCPLVYVGQERQQFRLPRAFGAPTIDSPLLGFGNDTSNPSALSTDFWGRMKPSGPGVTWSSANKAIGYMEAHDFGSQENTIKEGVLDTDKSVRMNGPGDHEFRFPVVAGTSLTISVDVYRDGSYGGGTLPSITLLDNALIGVVTQTVTDAGSASAWNTLSLTAFTPTANGWVSVRLVSNAAGTGKVYWDNFSVV